MANIVTTALALCGVDTDMNNIIFNRSTTSVRIASEIFDDSWAVAAGIIRIAWIDTKMNLADAMTKKLTVETRNRLFGDWMY